MRVVLSGIMTTGEAVGADVGGVMVGVTDGLADTRSIGIATGDGAPDAAVAKQIANTVMLRARRYRIFGKGRINLMGAGRANGRVRRISTVAEQSHYHLTCAASIGVAVREAAAEASPRSL